MGLHERYEEEPQLLRDLDEWCLRHMAYWGEQVQRRQSLEHAPDSPIAEARERLEAQRGDPLLEANIAVLAWRSLGSAGEHAGLAHWIHQSTGGGVVPRPRMSLARAAMLGAARVIYLLEPDSAQERSIRTAALANREVIDARDYLKVLASIHGDPESLALAEVQRYFDAVKSEAEALLSDAGEKIDRRMTEIEILKKVAPILSDGSQHPEFSVMSAWSKGSAVAHGRSWVWAAMPEHAHPVEEFVTVWSVPVGLIGHAWSLWNLRRGSDTPPATPPPGWTMDPALAGIPEQASVTKTMRSQFLDKLRRIKKTPREPPEA